MAKKTNQFIIDLGNIAMTEEQKKALNKALHKTVAKQMKEISVVRSRNAGTSRGMASPGITEEGLLTATLDVTFTNTEPGLSLLTATCAGKEQTINRSGKIVVNNAKKGRRIKIQGDSLGNTTITIDIAASPMQMNFAPGHIAGSFFIL